MVKESHVGLDGCNGGLAEGIGWCYGAIHWSLGRIPLFGLYSRDKSNAYGEIILHVLEES